MSDLQIVGMGLSTLDILMRLPQMPTWDSPNYLDEIKFDGGGPAGTAVVTAARLGAKTGFVGTAGNDWVAEIKLRSLRADGVDTSRVIVHNQSETQVIVGYVDSNSGERVFTGPKNFFQYPLKVEDLDKDYITSCEYLLIDGFHYEASLQAAKWMHTAGKQVVLDAAASKANISTKMSELVKVTDVLICGSGFAQALSNKEKTWEAGEAALTFGPHIVVMTEGAKGSYLVTGQTRFHTPAFQVDVVDTTGAGDVFHGAFVFGLIQGWDLHKISQFSTATSAIECTRLGGRAGIPTYDEVIHFLKTHNIDFLKEVK